MPLSQSCFWHSGLKIKVLEDCLAELLGWSQGMVSLSVITLHLRPAVVIHFYRNYSPLFACLSAKWKASFPWILPELVSYCQLHCFSLGLSRQELQLPGGLQCIYLKGSQITSKGELPSRKRNTTVLLIPKQNLVRTHSRFPSEGKWGFF